MKENDEKKPKKDKKHKRKFIKSKDNSSGFHILPSTKYIGKAILSCKNESFLNYKIGDEIAIISQSNNNIWFGSCNGNTGLFDYNDIQLETNSHSLEKFENLINVSNYNPNF